MPQAGRLVYDDGLVSPDYWVAKVQKEGKVAGEGYDGGVGLVEVVPVVVSHSV